MDGLPSGLQGVRLDFRHRITSGAELTAEAVKLGAAWQAAAILPLAGSWEVAVIVREDTFSEERGRCTIGISPGSRANGSAP